MTSPDFNERLSTAAKAKQPTLEKFQARPRADDPAAVERQAARLATSQARDARRAARAAETARVEEEAIHQAAENVARKAAAEVEKAAQEVTLEAGRKPHHDPRGTRGTALGRGARGSVAPKYRNPKDPSQTWAGRGLQTHWVRDAPKSGKKLDSFLIAKAR